MAMLFRKKSKMAVKEDVCGDNTVVIRSSDGESCQCDGLRASEVEVLELGIIL